MTHRDDPARTTPHTPPAPPPVETTPHTPAGFDRTPPAPDGPGTVARTDSAPATPPDGVPGYELLAELGRGGMGVVYKARHTKLNRVVALKMMLGAARTDRLRFLAEAEAVAAVRHPNVVQVYDYGESFDRPYMALEFCPGGTLIDRMPKGAEQATDPRGAAELVSEVARGVAAAHARGIVHRDLKPGNVLLQVSSEQWAVGSKDPSEKSSSSLPTAHCPPPTLTPKVADFGLAKRGPGADVTRENVAMGTPAYMAPEQAQNAKFVGPQADVWALGVILYEALTGTRPFTGTLTEILAKAQTDAPAAPRKVVPAVPRDLELICLHCLAKAPHERYPTAKELADDLDRYLRNEPISVRPAGPLERAVKAVKRNKLLSGSVAAVVTALAVGAGVSLAFGLEARKQAREAEEAAIREEREKLAASAARDEARANLREAVTTTASFLALAPELEESFGKNTMLLAQLSDKAESNLDRLRKAGDSVEVLTQQAGLQELLARLHWNQARTDRALPAANAAIAAYDELARGSPSAEVRAARARAYLARSYVHIARGASPAALTDGRRALELAGELTAAEPAEVRWKHLRAQCLTQVGFANWIQGRFPEGDRFHDEALALREEMAKAPAVAADPMYRRYLARTHYNRGWALSNRYDPAASDSYQTAHDLLEPIATKSVPAQFDLAEMCIDLNPAAQRAGDTARATKLLTTARRLCDGLLQADPNNVEVIRLEMRVTIGWAQLLPPGADRDKAAADQQQAVEKMRERCAQLVAADPGNAAWAARLCSSRLLSAQNLMALNSKPKPKPTDAVFKQVEGYVQANEVDTKRLADADPDSYNAVQGTQSAMVLRSLFDQWAGREQVVEQVRAANRPAMEFYARRAAAEPTRAEWFVELGNLYAAAADRDLLNKRYEAMEDGCRDGLQALAAGPNAPAVERLRGQLALNLGSARMYRDDGRNDPEALAAAAAALRQAVATFEKLAAQAPDRELTGLWVTATDQLASALGALNQKAEADAIRATTRTRRLEIAENQVRAREFLPKQAKFVSETTSERLLAEKRRKLAAEQIRLTTTAFKLRANSDKALDLAEAHLNAARTIDPTAADFPIRAGEHLAAVLKTYDELRTRSGQPPTPAEETLLNAVRAAAQELSGK